MSLFDLKQNADELPSLNQGIAKLTYQQVQTTRNATGDAFPKGNINLKIDKEKSDIFSLGLTILRSVFLIE